MEKRGRDERKEGALIGLKKKKRQVSLQGCAVVGLGGGKSSVKFTLHMLLPQQQKW